ncbi:MAG TPA: hypothetical protein PLD01_12110 [Mycobacterium sp.]|nr:hypothetical protein [Mycobacterium sp.]
MTELHRPSDGKSGLMDSGRSGLRVLDRSGVINMNRLLGDLAMYCGH